METHIKMQGMEYTKRTVDARGGPYSPVKAEIVYSRTAPWCRILQRFAACARQLHTMGGRRLFALGDGLTGGVRDRRIFGRVMFVATTRDALHDMVGIDIEEKRYGVTRC